MQVKPEELIPILVAHGIGVNVGTNTTLEPVPLDKLGAAIGYMLSNEVNGNGMVADMAGLITRMATRLRGEDSGLAIKAVAFLERRGLTPPDEEDHGKRERRDPHRAFRPDDPPVERIPVFAELGPADAEKAMRRATKQVRRD